MKHHSWFSFVGRTVGRLIGLVLIGCIAGAHADEPFVVHEWGTFTAVHASDGSLLTGLEREEQALPGFVHSHTAFAAASKGWARPVRNVTIKMETPVIYFYADRERAVNVEVGFKGGSISQWYPKRSDGEAMDIMPQDRATPVVPVDFGTGFTGRIVWKATVLAPGSVEKITAPVDWETPQWPRARVAGANRVRTADGAVEGFLFYRGLGNFALPLRIVSDESGRITVENRGAETIPYLLAYERTPAGDVLIREISHVYPGERRVLPARENLKPRFAAELMLAGLSVGEASAMLATWKESYFERPGLRVFWVVPRAFTDRILPLTITPAPEKTERVLVGRSEVLTPAFERELADGFRKDGGQRWAEDRYFLAYRERARQLGVVMPVNTP